MVLEQLGFLYQNPLYLEYLRFHPQWYKILHYSPESFKDFLEEANAAMHLTSKDRLVDLNKKMSFISSLIGYLAKK